MAFWRTKAAISLKRVKIEEKLLYGGPIGTHQRSFERYDPRPPMASPSSRLRVCNLAIPLLSQKQVNLWTSNLAGIIYRANPNNIPLKNLEKMERGRIQGLPYFWVPLLYQERVKQRTSNFVGTFIGSIGTKAHKNIGNSSRGRSQGVPKVFRTPMYRAHCAVIFAIAQLSC